MPARVGEELLPGELVRWMSIVSGVGGKVGKNWRRVGDLVYRQDGVVGSGKVKEVEGCKGDNEKPQEIL